MLELRADPWAPEYGMGYQARPEEPDHVADPTVETNDWTRARTPTASGLDGPVLFVDGVRRVELRLLAREGGAEAPGLFGSYAVGAVRCQSRAAFDRHQVERRIVVGGGLPAQVVELEVGPARLCFQPIREPSSEPDAPLARLQDAMRADENALAAALSGAGAPLVVVDGPLRLGESIEGPIVGAVKRFVRRYLEPEHDRLIGHLQAGERTPVFGLQAADGAGLGYSWYTRVARLSGPWHDHAGVLRCEVRASLGLDVAVAMADRVTALLPVFAGRPADPRTPQNLVPIAGLESWLRHRMGDARMVRRALLVRLSAEERTAAHG